MALVPRGHQEKMAETYLHPKVEWVSVEGSPFPPDRSEIVAQSNSGANQVAIAQTDEATTSRQIRCFKSKFQTDEKFVLEMLSSDLSTEVFVTSLENANPGLVHIEVSRVSVAFHFGPDNNLDPVFPSLRLNDSNKNVIELIPVCDYTNANSYIDQRINIHMNKRRVAGNGNVHTEDDDLASFFAEGIFTQDRNAQSISDATAQQSDVTAQQSDAISKVVVVALSSSASQRDDTIPLESELTGNYGS